GRKPPKAAPVATPAIAASEIGVSMTRRWPNSSDNPNVTVNAPPKPPSTPISSPRRMTRSSRRISSRSASRSASTIVSSRPCGLATALFREDIGQTILRAWLRALLSPGDCLVQFVIYGRSDFSHSFGSEQPLGQQARLVSRDGVAYLPPGHLLGCAVMPGIAA